MAGRTKAQARRSAVLPAAVLVNDAGARRATEVACRLLSEWQDALPFWRVIVIESSRGSPKNVSPYLQKPLRSLEEALAEIELRKLDATVRRWRSSLGLPIVSEEPDETDGA